MTPQALHQRLHTPQAVAWRQEVWPRALRAPRAPLYAQLPAGRLAPFGWVLRAESPPCCRRAKLAEALPGSGGRASRSPVPIAGIDARLPHQRSDLAVTDGRATEQGRAAAMVAHRRAGDRGLRD